MSLWYYTLDNRRRLGPVTGDELRALAVAGTLRPDCLVMPEAGGKWVPASKVKRLFPKPALPASQPSGAVNVPCPGCGRAIPLRQHELSLVIQCAKCGTQFTPSQPSAQGTASSTPLDDPVLMGLVKDAEPVAPAAMPLTVPWHRNRRRMKWFAIIFSGLLLAAFILIGAGCVHNYTEQASLEASNAILARNRAWSDSDVLSTRKWLAASKAAKVYWTFATPLIALCLTGCGIMAAAFVVARLFEGKVKQSIAAAALRLRECGNWLAEGFPLKPASGPESSAPSRNAEPDQQISHREPLNAPSVLPAPGEPMAQAVAPVPPPWHRNPAWLILLGLLGVACVTTVVVLTARGNIYDVKEKLAFDDYVEVKFKRGGSLWDFRAVENNLFRAQDDARAYWAVAQPVRVACILVCAVLGAALVVVRAREKKHPQQVG